MITTTFLEIRTISDLHTPKESGGNASGMHLRKIDCPLDCASLYSAVGKSQYWEVYRYGWTPSHWNRYLQRSDIEISFICAKDGTQIGYLELQLHQDASVEIVNFGLRPEFIGQGLGGHALTLAIRHCFELGADGVWLHTCSLDHPSALKNYYARGFKFIREEVADYLPLDAMPEAVGQVIELARA